jgi:hypothetical protein
VLIVGKNERSEKYVRRILSEKELGYRFCGYIDTKRDEITEDEKKLFACDFEGFREYLRKNVIDEIFMFLPIKSFYDKLNEIVTICEEQGIIVRMCTDLFCLRFAKVRVEQVDSDMHITLFTGNMHRPSIVVKEMLDFFLAIFFIIVTLPLMIVTALLIKIFSPGPVFFRQERIGLHKRHFRIIKFRTMYVDAEQKLDKLEQYNETGGNGAFKMKNDPRVTPLGKLLRNTALMSSHSFLMFSGGK